MNIVRFFLVFSLLLLAGASPQDLNDLFSLYAGKGNASDRQYYTIQFLEEAPQSVQVNATEGSPSIDNDDFVDDDDEDNNIDSMEDFFYENGFVEISNDDVYDYSYAPMKPEALSASDNVASKDGSDGERIPAEEAVAEKLDDEEDEVDMDQAANETVSTAAPVTMAPEIDEDTENSGALVDPEPDSEDSLSVDLPDQVISPFVHPIHRPSSEWPLNATQIGNPSNQGNRKPARRPNRRPRPQGNRRPVVQQNGRPQNKRRRRRRKPQKGNRRPIGGQKNKRKRIRYPKKPPVKLPPFDDPNYDRIHQFFEPPNCAECQCGVTTTRRIVGGTIAAVNEFPWLALIAYNGTIQCGGTLINDRYVLTAAHCVRGFDSKQFQIRFLEYNRAIDSETTVVIRKAARIYSLETYNARTADNDIAVVRLSSPIAFETTTVRPICLPAAGTKFVGFNGIVAGWGATRESGTMSKILRKAKVPILSNSQCALVGMSITENMLCAGRLLSGGVDACQGDSGGPLMVIESKRYFLAGIVSWGDGCARPKKPGVYARVTKYLPWIRRLSTGSCSCY